MPASIVLTSSSFATGSIIPPKFKNSTICIELNDSPQFTWQPVGFPLSYVDWFGFGVEDHDRPGSSPYGTFLHWRVTHIDPNQSSIAENGVWIGAAVVHPTDYVTGDRTNGWNGPCCGSVQHNYRAMIGAKIKDEFVKDIFGSRPPEDHILWSNPYYFLDNDQNHSVTLETTCWLIQNCQDENETYHIKFATGESPLYGNDVYSLSGATVFADKCFILIQQEYCVVADYEAITIVQHYGTSACTLCFPSHKFQSCLDDSFVWLTLAVGQPQPSQDTIYTLSIGNVCYTYVSLVTDHYPEYTDVTVIHSYKGDDCSICGGCYKFANCVGDTTVIVSFAAGQVVPTTAEIGQVYELAGNAYVINKCWKYVGKVDCVESLSNITIVHHYECKECIVCNKYYLLTNCADPTDTTYIWWAMLAAPLDPDTAYIFDFALNTCYTATLEFTPCYTGISPAIHDASNIDTSYPLGCDDCNKLCYKLIDCEQYQTVSTDQDLSVYVGHVIQWEDEQQVRRCATVEVYICRRETYPVVLVTVMDCFHTCLECNPPAPPEPEFSITHRAVQPGRTVPECSTGSSCSSCCDTDCSTVTSPCEAPLPCSSTCNPC